jgi:Protein of unknown function (DUF4058)
MRREVRPLPSPFPGMDPYLERGRVWSDLHHSLITAIRDALAPQVAPAYYVAIEERVTTVEVARGENVREPDAAIIPTRPVPVPSGGVAVAEAPAATAIRVTLPRYETVREGYLEIRGVQNQVVVTAIEVLSPTNKLSSEGRQEYEKKRRAVLSSVTSLIEIDLLRAGEPMQMEPLPMSDYRLLVSRGWEHPEASLHAFSIRQAIPAITVPLQWSEAEVSLSVGELLAQVYDRARYDLRVDYKAAPPEPALSAEDAAWVDALLREKGLRAAAEG